MNGSRIVFTPTQGKEYECKNHHKNGLKINEYTGYRRAYILQPNNGKKIGQKGDPNNYKNDFIPNGGWNTLKSRRR
jgi:hypothetical protein